MKFFLVVVLSAVVSGMSFASVSLKSGGRPKIFLFLGSNPSRKALLGYDTLLKNKGIAGIQIVYKWRGLEPKKDVYDFASLEKVLSFLKKRHKKLWVQIQDRSFTPKAFVVPPYLTRDPRYAGGEEKQSNADRSTGWVAKQWNPEVRMRFQKLLMALGKRFDGRVYGVNLPEAAVNRLSMPEPSQTFCRTYFRAVISNMMALRKAFKRTHVVQYVNYMPCEWTNDHHYIGRVFQTAMDNKIGLGGPDVVPCLKTQMSNTYPLFNTYKKNLFVAMAVQSADYWNIRQIVGRKHRPSDFYNFAKEYLGADVIFWVVSEPEFSKKFVPAFENQSLFTTPTRKRLAGCRPPFYYKVPTLRF